MIEKTIKEAGDKVSDADKAPIDAAIAKVREALKGTDVTALKNASAELEQTSSRDGSALVFEGGCGIGWPGRRPDDTGRRDEARRRRDRRRV